jgi:hypothetical protein
MKLLLVSDSKQVTSEIEALVQEHLAATVKVISGEELVAQNPTADYDVILAEWSTWQRYASIYRYFKLTQKLDQSIIVSVNKGRRGTHLKTRLGRRDVILFSPFNKETFLKALEEHKTTQEQQRTLRSIGA